MKKKIFSAIACFAMILVAGLALTACGGTTTPISADELEAYILGEEVVTTINDYKAVVTMSQTIDGVSMQNKAEGIVINSGEALQFAVKSSTTAGDSTFSMEIYCDGENVYTNALGNQTYVPYDEDTNTGIGMSGIQSNGEFKEMILDAIKSEEGMQDIEIKQTVNGNTTTFTITGSQEMGIDEIGEGKLVLTFVKNELTKVQMTMSYDGMKITSTITAYSGSIKFPSFKGYTPAI